MPYTANQLFWISFAQVAKIIDNFLSIFKKNANNILQTKCSIYRDQSLKDLILDGKHSPNNFRVIGPLSNDENFAQDFKCSANSKMNPRSKCKVW